MSSSQQTQVQTGNTVTTTDENGVKTTTTTRVITGQTQVSGTQIAQQPVQTRTSTTRVVSNPVTTSTVVQRHTTAPQVIRTRAEPQVIRTTAPVVRRQAPITTTTTTGSVVVQNPRVVRATPTTTTQTVTRTPVTTTSQVITREEPVTTTTTTQAPVQVPTQQLDNTLNVSSINSAPVNQSSVQNINLNASTIKVDDEARYRTHAEELHGYGRANTKARYGTENRIYNNRFNKDLRGAIIGGKTTSSEYRNDSNCTLI